MVLVWVGIRLIIAPSYGDMPRRHVDPMRPGVGAFRWTIGDWSHEGCPSVGQRGGRPCWVRSERPPVADLSRPFLNSVDDGLPCRVSAPEVLGSEVVGPHGGLCFVLVLPPRLQVWGDTEVKVPVDSVGQYLRAN